MCVAVLCEGVCVLLWYVKHVLLWYVKLVCLCVVDVRP